MKSIIICSPPVIINYLCSLWYCSK